MRAQRSPRLSLLFGLMLFAALPFACGKRAAAPVAAAEQPAPIVVQR